MSLEDVSLQSGAFLVAVISTAAVALISCLKRPSGKFWYLIAAFVVPFALANGLYWSAAWEATAPYAFADYKMWAPVFIIPCFLAGAIPSVAVVLIVRRPKPRAKQDSRPT